MTTSQLRPPLDPAVWERAARVLDASFPATELGSLDDIHDQITQGSRRLWVNDDVTAVAVTFDLATPSRDVLLEFIAVAPDARSRGVGAALLTDLAALAGGPIVLEVENPDVVPTEEARRRVVFYERLGGTVLPGARSYAMPNLAGTGTLPMWLIEMDPVRAAELAGDELRDLVAAIWVRGYGREPADRDFMSVVRAMARG